jgi:arginine repressor
MDMKTKLNFRKLITHSLIAVFVLTASSELIAQEKKSDDLKNFKVVVEKTDNRIKMQSLEGSAWIDLSFSIKNDRPQAIDEYGKTELNKISSKKNSNLADFLFTITKTENGIILKGIEGTAWTDLSFTLLENGKQTIDQFGMTKRD